MDFRIRPSEILHPERGGRGDHIIEISSCTKIPGIGLGVKVTLEFFREIPDVSAHAGAFSWNHSRAIACSVASRSCSNPSLKKLVLFFQYEVEQCECISYVGVGCSFAYRLGGLFVGVL